MFSLEISMAWRVSPAIAAIHAIGCRPHNVRLQGTLVARSSPGEPIFYRIGTLAVASILRWPQNVYVMEHIVAVKFNGIDLCADAYYQALACPDPASFISKRMAMEFAGTDFVDRAERFLDGDLSLADLLESAGGDYADL